MLRHKGKCLRNADRLVLQAVILIENPNRNLELEVVHLILQARAQHQSARDHKLLNPPNLTAPAAHVTVTNLMIITPHSVLKENGPVTAIVKGLEEMILRREVPTRQDPLHVAAKGDIAATATWNDGTVDIAMTGPAGIPPAEEAVAAKRETQIKAFRRSRSITDLLPRLPESRLLWDLSMIAIRARRRHDIPLHVLNIHDANQKGLNMKNTLARRNITDQDHHGTTVTALVMNKIEMIETKSGRTAIPVDGVSFTTTILKRQRARQNANATNNVGSKFLYLFM